MNAYDDSNLQAIDALAVPFAADEVDWRIGSTNQDKTKGLPLAYIDARTVMDRLDRVCGAENWQCNYTPAPGLLVCNLGIRLPNSGEFIWKADGAGATDVEGEKGMLSDALKRAAVRWGVGRYLYELKSDWVPIEPRGKSWIIPKTELKKLQELHEDFAQKCGWGDRAGVYAYRVARRAIEQFVHSADAAQEFRNNNAGMIAQLPVAMRRHLNDTLDRIGAPASEAAE